MMTRWCNRFSVAISVVVLAAGMAPYPAAAQFDEQSEGDEELFGDEAGGAEASDDEAPAHGSVVEDVEPSAASESNTGGESDMALSIGLKVGGGGNLVTTPDNPPVATQPFDDGAGGYAFTVGPYGELRLLDGLLGFQTGLILDFVTNLSEIDRNGVDETWGWSAMDLRIPILVQIGTPGDGTRLYAQTGLEVVVGLSGEPTADTPALPPLTVNTVTRPNWIAGLGLSSPLGPVRLSFDIQFALNLAASAEYAERVSTTLVPVGRAVEAQHNMDLRLLLGVAYDLKL